MAQLVDMLPLSKVTGLHHGLGPFRVEFECSIHTHVGFLHRPKLSMLGSLSTFVLVSYYGTTVPQRLYYIMSLLTGRRK